MFLLLKLFRSQVVREAGIEPGVERREQLSDRQPLSGFGPSSSLPVLHLLRRPPQTPLLWPPVLRVLHRPHRQHGLRGHRGSGGVPLPRLQVAAPPQRLRLLAAREPKTADRRRRPPGLNVHAPFIEKFWHPTANGRRGERGPGNGNPSVEPWIFPNVIISQQAKQKQNNAS